MSDTIIITHPKHGDVHVSKEQWGNPADESWSEAAATARGYKIKEAKADKADKPEK